MNTQPEALRLADLIDWPSIKYGHEAADELRRLHEVEQGIEALMNETIACIEAIRSQATRIATLEQANQELLEALQDLCATLGECGMTTNARAVIAKHGSET